MAQGVKDATQQVTTRATSKAQQTARMPQHRTRTPTNCSGLDSIIWYLFPPHLPKKNSEPGLGNSHEPEHAGFSQIAAPALPDKHISKNLVTTKYLSNPQYLI